MIIAEVDNAWVLTSNSIICLKCSNPSA